MPDSPTFGEVFQQGEFPAQMYATSAPTLWKAPARESETITVERAHELVQEIQATSRWGFLQLSKTYQMSPAAALARNVRSLTLSGLTTISPEVEEKLAETVGGLSLPSKCASWLKRWATARSVRECWPPPESACRV